ncbi:hypothetical protein BATDEDRAFT_88329 [Batrachochytrium dendrobatidis JAM81]|uniref:Uncharacterized protein n=1 Tax=Batrachochytrium dendrobatidis (strain JAM81 / FGSC 10211) TaxID=684364 RepID=F4P1C8_BATDJ|nr:uncharacterized protein BATDEDRAFT_88329 [Batrachochytrium dendrobatidis JAM81]EGF80612.1 hypothetical protein BATDEDRAFT_88329 [Batrachochytrium dendrobatidis JAM81]|eukprot:XP_006678633.1 hypothetical protein BATDEDRAFT_88329 [Batrachochytrium dendrobatidis JAM81]
MTAMQYRACIVTDALCTINKCATVTRYIDSDMQHYAVFTMIMFLINLGLNTWFVMLDRVNVSWTAI